MSDAQVYIDVEAHFRSGRLLCLSVLEGRDVLSTDGQHVRVELNPTPDATDVHIFDKADLDYLRTTRRVVEPETQVTDGGSLRVTGDTPTA